VEPDLIEGEEAAGIEHGLYAPDEGGEAVEQRAVLACARLSAGERRMRRGAGTCIRLQASGRLLDNAVELFGHASRDSAEKKKIPKTTAKVFELKQPFSNRHAAVNTTLSKSTQQISSSLKKHHYLSTSSPPSPPFHPLPPIPPPSPPRAAKPRQPQQQPRQRSTQRFVDFLVG
jgi:hypothetical protein